MESGWHSYNVFEFFNVADHIYFIFLSRYQISVAELPTISDAGTHSSCDFLDEFFVKLRAFVDQHTFTPGDVIRMGNLEFAALR